MNRHGIIVCIVNAPMTIPTVDKFWWSLSRKVEGRREGDKFGRVDSRTDRDGILSWSRRATLFEDSLAIQLLSIYYYYLCRDSGMGLKRRSDVQEQ